MRGDLAGGAGLRGGGAYEDGTVGSGVRERSSVSDSGKIKFYRGERGETGGEMTFSEALEGFKKPEVMGLKIGDMTPPVPKPRIDRSWMKFPSTADEKDK